MDTYKSVKWWITFVTSFCLVILFSLVSTDATTSSRQVQKRVVFIAGSCSHGRGEHEYKAGCLLLAKQLQEQVPSLQTQVYTDGWPQDPAAFRNVAAVIFYVDGGDVHPVNTHLQEIDKLMKKGVGLACLHYAIEVPKGKPGNYFLDWIGGFFETYWSVNPVWTAEFKTLPNHPITRGVNPFMIQDEWYYHMRFPEKMEEITPILSAVPPASTLRRPDGSHGNNPYVRAEKGKPQIVAWCRERPDGGRGFGFSGGHYHRVWADDNYRKLVLNAITWLARVDVPMSGVNSQTPTQAEIAANQCDK